MGLIKEPKNIDFTVQSQPWTEVELRDFRALMKKIKVKKTEKKVTTVTKKKKSVML